VVFVCWGSTNTSLIDFYFQENKIGDVGASSIAAGLAYVSFLLPIDIRSFRLTLSIIFLLYITDWQSKQDVEETNSALQPDSCRGHSCAETRTPGIFLFKPIP
jgi:hypothetical protein